MRSLLFVLLPAALAAAQGSALPGATAELTTALDAKLPNESVAAIGKIVEAYPKATEEEQKAAITAVGKAAGDKELRIRHAAFTALGTLKAKGSSKYLSKWLSPPKTFKGEIPTSYVEAIRAAGQIADAATLNPILDISDHGTLEIAMAATEAIGGYSGLPVGRRKSLAFDLVDRLRMLATPSRRADYSEGEVARRAGLANSTKIALQRLTGLKYESVDGWVNWKDEAKNKTNPFE